ncbi:MarR family transcriptional regulator [Leucobacter sp. CSA1]|uniref:MarR family transcriptional regulator n=1 Tax=Leucobacter chromiisoli TaxID=2796471 RepID=A0A934Q928_9MICO|nr:MarR family transcriptional regulator [Leucobacter chromiisoli]MBK0419371.1 MarR family transcriptional regulator [Leucobacter chromiisoli]
MAEPQWLDSEERELWLRLVSLTILLPGALESQLKRDAGVTLFDYHVLAMLSDAEDRTRLMSDLAFFTNSSLSRLSHVVTRLEKQGWVRREACPSDGRATNVVLTDEGFAHLEEQAPEHVRTVRRLVLDPLGREGLREFSMQLGRILEAVDPDRRRIADA